MEAIVEEIVSPDDLKKFERIYKEQTIRGPPSAKAQFEYAWCLVRSKYKDDQKHGAALLEDLFKKTADETAKRDYLFYLSVGHTRLKEYDLALKYVKGIQQVEPSNHQAKALEDYIKDKMKKEGLVGMAIVGGAAAVGLGALVGIGTLIGVTLAKKAR